MVRQFSIASTIKLVDVKFDDKKNYVSSETLAEIEVVVTGATRETVATASATVQGAAVDVIESVSPEEAVPVFD